MSQDTAKIVSMAVLNAEVAGDCVTANGVIRIRGCEPITQKNFKSVTKTVAVAEKAQIVTVTTPTIVADTIYGVRAKGFGNRREGERDIFRKYTQRTPATLTGTALTDKYNWARLVGIKIVAGESESVQAAGPSITFTKAASTWLVGEKITDDTSGAIGYVVATASTTATAIVVSGTFANSDTAHTTSAATPVAISSVTVVGNLVILDKTGYWASKKAGYRQGKTAIIPANALIPQTSIAVTVAAVIGKGQGTRLLEDVHYSDNLQSGIVGFAGKDGSNSPTAGLTYTQYIVEEAVPASSTSQSNQQGTIRRLHIIYADDAASGYSAFDTLMLALAAA